MLGKKYVAILVNANAGAIGGRGSPEKTVRRAVSEMTAPYRIFVTSTLEQLDAACAEIMGDADCAAVAVAGGDGTLHHVLSRLNVVWIKTGRRIPPIVLLPLGTMNIIAHALGLPLDSSARLLRRTAKVISTGRIPFVERRALCVNDDTGFIYGAGLPVRILEMFYGSSGPPAFRVAKLVGRAAIGGIVAPELEIRNAHIEPSQPRRQTTIVSGKYTVVIAGTVEKVGFDLRVLPGAGRSDDAFVLRLSRLSAAAIARQIKAVRQGQWMPETDDFDSRQAAFEFVQPTTYMVDGELKPAVRAHVINKGPIIRFII